MKIITNSQERHFTADEIIDIALTEGEKWYIDAQFEWLRYVIQLRPKWFPWHLPSPEDY